MIELTPELIRKHAKLLEGQVKGYSKRSKKGKSFTVGQYARKDRKRKYEIPAGAPATSTDRLLGKAPPYSDKAARDYRLRGMMKSAKALTRANNAGSLLDDLKKGGWELNRALGTNKIVKSRGAHVFSIPRTNWELHYNAKNSHWSIFSTVNGADYVGGSNMKSLLNMLAGKNKKWNQFRAFPPGT